jgi:lipid A ethanolaminephosphotransferase
MNSDPGKPSGDILIVLHQMGSHGPAYYKRYPKAFQVFVPTCDTNQLDSCSEAEIVNAYDNTILYTDHFLHKVVEMLRRNADMAAMRGLRDVPLSHDNLFHTLHGLFEIDSEVNDGSKDLLQKSRDLAGNPAGSS